MNKASKSLQDLASVIGWKLVNDDKGFKNFEYEICMSKYENISHVVRILDEPNEIEICEILLTLIKVLPSKLKRKVNKLMGKFKMEDFVNLSEVATFTIEEYKKSTEFYKLQVYGDMLGVNIEEKGYTFEYRLRKNKRSEILSVIENKLPMEIAPAVGKIKKIDYKIAYIKNNRIINNENE